MNGGQKLAFISLMLHICPVVMFIITIGGKINRKAIASTFSVFRLKYPGMDLQPLPFVFPLMLSICFILDLPALIYLFQLEGKQKVFGTRYYTCWSIHALALTGWFFTYTSEKLFLTAVMIYSYGISSILIMVMTLKKAESLSDKSAGFTAKWFDLVVVTGSSCWASYFSIFGNSLFLTATLMYEDGPSAEIGTLRGSIDQSTACIIGLIPAVIMWSAWIVSDLALFHRYTRHSYVTYPFYVMLCCGVLGKYSSTTGPTTTDKIYLFMGVVSLVAWALRGNSYSDKKLTKSE